MIKLEFKKFKKRIEELISIETPIIWINTKEEDKAEKGVIDSILLKKNNCKYFYVMDDTGVWRIDPITRRPIQTENTQDIRSQLFNNDNNNNFIYPDSPTVSDMLKLLETCMDNVSLIIRDSQNLMTDISMQRMLYNLTVRKSNVNNIYTPIIIIASTDRVPSIIQESVKSVNLPLLTEKENIIYIQNWLKVNNINIKEPIQDIGKAATGLTIFQMQQTLKDAIANGNNENIKYLNEARSAIIKQSGILTYIEPKKNLDDIGGHNLLKKWIKDTKKCMTPEAEKFGIKPTKGTICMGLAGTGKSLIAEAIANYFNAPFVIFDLSKIMGGLVGQSERTARTAFELINALGKCVVLFDEADKKFAGANGRGEHDGGTFARVFDVILENLQNNKNQFYILTANDISKLPSPLMRSGRLDTKWFFDLPNEHERTEIFKIHFRNANKDISNELLEFAAKFANHFTGAEIETAVNNILRSAFMTNKIIDKTAITIGINLVSPIWKTNKKEIDELTQYAKINNIPYTSSTEFLNKPMIKGGEDRLRNLEEVAAQTITV